MVEVARKIKEKNLKSKLILQIHDELVFDTKIDEIDEIKNIMINAMENAITLDVPLKVDINEGKNLYEAK